MIKFDYSLKKLKFSELDIGNFFILNEKDNDLYMKLHNVKEYFQIEVRLEKEVPIYNSYMFNTGRMYKIDYNQDVIKCDVNMTVCPLR